MSKTLAPKWANWKAQNVDGSWYYFEQKPKLIENGWLEEENSKVLFSHRSKQRSQWTTSLSEITEEDIKPEKVHRLFG